MWGNFDPRLNYFFFCWISAHNTRNSLSYIRIWQCKSSTVEQRWNDMFTNYGKRLSWQAWLTACDPLHGRQKFIAFDFCPPLVSVILEKPKESILHASVVVERKWPSLEYSVFLGTQRNEGARFNHNCSDRDWLVTILWCLLCDSVSRWNSSKCKMIPTSTCRNNAQPNTIYDMNGFYTRM